MGALAHLEAIGYTVKFYDEKAPRAFWIAGINSEPIPDTVWKYVEQHNEEIQQALRQRIEA